MGEMENTGIFLWDLQRNEMHTVVYYNMESYTHPTFSPDGTLLIVTGGNYLGGGGATLDSAFYIFDVASQNQLTILANHTEAPLQVEMSQDKRLIVSASRDGTIRLWGVPKS
jgi:WD40 repeat protein